MEQPLRVLLTNDDGINAPGMAALERAFEARSDAEVWTVAPDRGRSTCSHGMSLSRPVFVRQAGERRVSVDGLPADCVYLAMYGLLPALPHVVVSGINLGANLGTDVIFSGTVAGAREAALQGVHGLAVSLVDGDDFDKVAASACEIALSMARSPREPTLLVNLNYPAGDFEGPRLARLGKRNYPKVVSQRSVPLTGQTYYWLGGPAIEDGRVPDTDGWMVSRGVASATLLRIDQTDMARMADAARLVPFLEPPEEK